MPIDDLVLPPSRHPGSLAVLALIVLLCGCGSVPPAAQKSGAGRQAPAAPVTTAVAVAKDLPRDVHAIGVMQASATVAVRSQVTGALVDVRFTEGDEVTKGQVLFAIDPRMLDQALKQAQANLEKTRSAEAQAEATLARDQAQAANAEREAGRYAGLHEQGITTTEQVEQLRATAEAARATVDADRAAIVTGKAATAADETAVESARVQLDYCTIRAPIDGRVGMLGVNRGALVTADTTTLVTINRIRPIYAVFAVPEQLLPDLRAHGSVAPLPVVASASSSGGTWRRDGVLDLIDNQIDRTTGTIPVRATFPNADGFLWPGQFVDLTITLEIQHGAIAVPSQAVQTGQKGDYVLVVSADQIAEARPVTVDRTVGSEAVIADGLAANETVVVDGHVRVVPGGKVAPADAAAADAQQKKPPAGGAREQGHGAKREAAAGAR